MVTQVDEKYTMTVDLAVLKSLGINLYSNAAAVLSELVANAYDADATKVSIEWRHGQDIVEVVDNGCGMTVDQLNDRFLTTGYEKRTVEGFASPKFARPFMGRKGIGKLAVFSIADVAEIYTSPKSGQYNAMRIELSSLEKSIRARKPYHPVPIEVPTRLRRPGTTLVLTNLKAKRADLTTAALRKRLARRFDVISNIPAADGGFRLEVNGKPVTYADRQDLKRLEFIWEFGGKKLPDSVLPSKVQRYVFSKDTVDAGHGWKVSGWIGTAPKPTDLTDDDEAGSLKNIIVIARKRPIQEGIIDKLDFSRLFGNYVTGQIEADFLDLDGGYEDIATSDRQRLIEDDERVVALQDFLRARFLEASEQWAKARPKKKGKDALGKYPKLRDWVDARPGWQRVPAEKMIDTIASLELEGDAPEKDRVELFRSGILAFERVGLRRTVEDLDNLTSLKAVDMLPVLAAQDTYEAALYVDILRSRLSAIAKFREISLADERERVLQVHLFEHLWLLDASWERATLSERMEQDLRRIAPGEFALDEAGKIAIGRIDIRYATTSGRHVIVELKRYSRKATIEELAEQGTRYAVALREVLAKIGQPNPVIEVVFVLGAPPTPQKKQMVSDEDYQQSLFGNFNGRCVFYDELVHNANAQYQEYIDATEKAKKLDDLLGSLNESSESAAKPSAKTIAPVKTTAARATKAVPKTALPAKKAAPKKAPAKKTVAPAKKVTKNTPKNLPAK